MDDTCVVAYEPSVDGLTVRDPRDASPVRFERVAEFKCYADADAAIGEIRGIARDGRMSTRRAVEEWLGEAFGPMRASTDSENADYEAMLSRLSRPLDDGEAVL